MKMNMDQWVVFGFGEYLIDIVDIIHCNGGKIRAVVGNIQSMGWHTYRSDRRLQNRIERCSACSRLLGMMASPALFYELR
jgi:hypothetical protein